MTNASLQFPPTPEEYRDNIRRQKALAVQIADKLRAGEPLSDMESSFAAFALGAFAEKLVETMPKPKHRPPKVNPSSVAVDYVFLMQSGVSSTKAKGMLATQYNVDIDTISNAVAKKGKDAAAIYGPGSPKK